MFAEQIIFLTITVHSHFEAFFQSAGLALVPPRDVYWAGIAFLALICQVSSNATLEESPAAITCQHAVMLSRSSVAANFAKNVLLGLCGRNQKKRVRNFPCMTFRLRRFGRLPLFVPRDCASQLGERDPLLIAEFYKANNLSFAGFYRGGEVFSRRLFLYKQFTLTQSV